MHTICNYSFKSRGFYECFKLKLVIEQQEVSLGCPVDSRTVVALSTAPSNLVFSIFLVLSVTSSYFLHLPPYFNYKIWVVFSLGFWIEGLNNFCHTRQSQEKPSTSDVSMVL